MILAEKITRLRKQVGWSQEELAEKMNVSRQSVSKWESTNSIPDLKKIIMLSSIFDVSIDYLLKDDIESSNTITQGVEVSIIQVSQEQALEYAENKINAALLIGKGVFLSVCSLIPLFALFAMAKTNQLMLTSDIAAPIGIIVLLVMVSIGVSFFIRTNQYENNHPTIENGAFDLAYGVSSIFKEKLQQYRPTYNLKLSIGIAMFIFSVMPLMFVSMLSVDSDIILIALIVMFFMVAVAVYIVIQISAKYEAYNTILKEGRSNTVKSRRTRRAEKLAAFYWPILTAIFIGWSLLTMNWGVTWIIWPVGAILFVALVGLMELLIKDDAL
jgi:transcriptional regulator with XRE-family HTH domain